jgi:hypothetical protein
VAKLAVGSKHEEESMRAATDLRLAQAREQAVARLKHEEEVTRRRLAETAAQKGVIVQKHAREIPVADVDVGAVDLEGSEVKLCITFDRNFSGYDKTTYTAELADLLGIPVAHIHIIGAKAGSVILNVVVAGGADVFRPTLDDLLAPAHANANEGRLMKMSAAGVRRVVVGDFGLALGAAVMEPRYNKVYTRDRTLAKAAANCERVFWSGGLHDGKHRGGRPYFCPSGWLRYNIKLEGINSSEEFDAKFHDWPVAYHGTQSRYAASILRSGLKSGSGCFLQGDEEGVYVSPSIAYSAHPRYAKPWWNAEKQEWVQMILQVRINPAFTRFDLRETLAVGDKAKVDPNIPNKRMEWIVMAPNTGVGGAMLGKINDRVICYGIMLRTAKDPRTLAQSRFWSSSCSSGAPNADGTLWVR